MTDERAEYHVDLIEWCRAERANALKNIEIIDRGNFRVGADKPGATIQDQTPELRATYERIFEQMERLLKKYSNTDL